MGIDAQMFIRSKRQRTEAEVLELAYRMSASLGTDLFTIDREGLYGQKPHHCLTIANKYDQDDEQLIEVHLSGRYYGIGHEDGSLADYIAIAEFIEEIAPDAEILYGGNSSDICAEPFGLSERKLLWRHFCKVGHTPYNDIFDKIGIDNWRPVCTLCCKPYLQCGIGQDYFVYRCSGCGHRIGILNKNKGEPK
jgi:hypothetical protein